MIILSSEIVLMHLCFNEGISCIFIDKILCAFAYSILFSESARKPLVFSSHTFYLWIIPWLLKVGCRWYIFNVLPEWLSYHYFSFIYVDRYTMWSFLLKDKSVFQKIEFTWAQKLGDTDPLPQKSDRVALKSSWLRERTSWI